MRKFCARRESPMGKVAYVGDDLPDLSILRRVGSLLLLQMPRQK